MKSIFYLLLISVTFWKCAQTSTPTSSAFRANPLADSVSIYTLQPYETVPENSEFIRELQMGQSLFSNNCGYKNLMNYANFTARQSGANLIHLTQIEKPALGNGCYHVTARLYKNPDAAEINKIVIQKQSANKSRLPQEADYAIVHFYRPKSYEGLIVTYDIKSDGKDVVGKSSNGHQFEYKTTTFGKHRFTGKTQKSDFVELDIQKGQEYFVRCGVTKGTSVAIPDMYVIENQVGIRETEQM